MPNKDFPGSPVRLIASMAEFTGSILGWGTKIPHPTVWQKKKKSPINQKKKKKTGKKEKNN